MNSENISTPKKEKKEIFKIFDDLNGYYLKLAIVNKKLLIIIFNIDLLDGIQYRIEMNLKEIQAAKKSFMVFKSIEEVYEAIIKLINSNKFKIVENNNNIILNIIVSDIFNQNQIITFQLQQENYDNNEFIKILVDEIKKMRNKIKIIDELKKENEKIKSEIIKLKNRINKITIEEFNKAYNLAIDNNSRNTILNLCDKKLGNEIIESLCKIELTNIKEIYLDNNNINNINSLENTEFKFLEILHIKGNQISNISVLEKVDYKSLKKLNLGDNNISDITVLAKVNFKKLESLNLGKNKKLSDISVLEKVDFKELKELHLFKCNISDIRPLGNSKFPFLELLSLNGNKIVDISILEKVKFKNLIKLYLSYNNITNIESLKNAKFDKLELLYLINNNIDKNKCWGTIDYIRSKIKDFQFD